MSCSPRLGPSYGRPAKRDRDIELDCAWHHPSRAPDPERYTVLDFRAFAALERLQRRGLLKEEVPERDGLYPSYPEYLQCCRAIARRLGVNLRDLDRALWKWNEMKMP